MRAPVIKGGRIGDMVVQVFEDEEFGTVEFVDHHERDQSKKALSSHLQIAAIEKQGLTAGWQERLRQRIANDINEKRKGNE